MNQEEEQLIQREDLLKDPLNDRKVPESECPLPVQKELQIERVFQSDKPPNYLLIKQYLEKQGKLSKELAMEIVARGGEILSKEPNLIRLEGQTIIFGDIHGQFYDLLSIFQNENVGCPSQVESKMVFMGDYVDRGLYGVETVLLVLMLKQCFPNKIYLLRGNHETRDLTTYYGFRDQCLDIYDEEFYNQVMEAFDQLPVAAVVNGKYFCVHGGISSNVTTIEAINDFDRKMEVPNEECLFSDLLWADPAEDEDADQDYQFNEGRKFSVCYGRQPTNKFLQQEGLQSIVRAHECKFEGYQLHRWNGEDKPPCVITVFSAPNYNFNNEGGVFVTGNEDGDFFVSYEETEKKPYVLPRVFDDAFQADPLCDAFRFFQADIIANTMDVFYHVCNMTLSCVDPALKQTMSNMQSVMSTDEKYIEKLVDLSKKNEQIKEQEDQGLLSPEEVRKSRDSPEMQQVMSIEKLLSAFEEDLGVEVDDGHLKPRRSIEQRLSIVKEISLIRSRSHAARNSIEMKNRLFAHQKTLIGNNYQNVDKFVDQREQLKIVRNLEKRLSVEISKCKNIDEEKTATRKETFESWKEMMKLDQQNDYHTNYKKKHPPQIIEQYEESNSASSLSNPVSGNLPSRDISQRGSTISVTAFDKNSIDSNDVSKQSTEKERQKNAIKFQDSLPQSDAESDKASQSSSQGSSPLRPEAESQSNIPSNLDQLQSDANISKVDFYTSPEAQIPKEQKQDPSSNNAFEEPRTSSVQRKRGRKLLSIENIDIDKLPTGYFSWSAAIRSPQSLKAFRLAGINPRELDPINGQALALTLQKKYQNKFQIQFMVKQHIDRANKLRHQKHDKVKEVRQSLEQQGERGAQITGSSDYSFNMARIKTPSKQLNPDSNQKGQKFTSPSSYSGTHKGQWYRTERGRKMHSQDFIADNVREAELSGTKRFGSSFSSRGSQYPPNKFYSRQKNGFVSGMVKVSDLTRYSKSRDQTGQRYNKTTQLPMLDEACDVQQVSQRKSILKQSAEGLQIRYKMDQVSNKTGMLAPVRSRQGIATPNKYTRPAQPKFILESVSRRLQVAHQNNMQKMLSNSNRLKNRGVFK